MLTSGDVVDLDLGKPEGREAGFRHPAVVVTAQRLLRQQPSVIHVVPLTSTIRGFDSEVTITADAANGLDHDSSAQCQHLRSTSIRRLIRTRGNVGPTAVAQIREILAVILDLPQG